MNTVPETKETVTIELNKQQFFAINFFVSMELFADERRYPEASDQDLKQLKKQLGEHLLTFAIDEAKT